MKNFLFAVSLDCPASPALGFKCKIGFDENKKRLNGTGFAWYLGDDFAAQIVKDCNSFEEAGMPKVLQEWRRFRSSIFMMNFYGASYDATLQNTQPYAKPLANREWSWMQQGDFDMHALRELAGDKRKMIYQPVGTTDSELTFSIILNRCIKKGYMNLREVGWSNLYSWFDELSKLGSANIVVSDGQYLVAYRTVKTDEKLFYARRKPHFKTNVLKSDTAEVSVDFSNGIDKLRTQVVFASEKLSDEPLWNEVMKGQMIVSASGTIVWDSAKDLKTSSMKIKKPENFLNQQELQLAASLTTTNNSMSEQKDGNAKPITEQYDHHPENAPEIEDILENNCVPVSRELDYYISNTLLNKGTRVMRVTHETIYTYDKPIERSEHVYRLIPMYNRFQQLLEYSLDVDVPAERMVYRDVYNNDVIHLTIDTPYRELSIISHSTVRIHRIDPDDFSHQLRKTKIPYAWMPGQRQTMQAFLIPPELPETQIRELTDYAMSFVRRNDYNLYDTLQDMNRTIYNDFEYKQKVTDFNTSAFEAYVLRQGVCQDFANLMICLARLLGIPARYRMGYIYTGADYGNKIQSEATHAWAELYIPYVGWRGFDPTNGKMVDQDYIRVACGRNYLDATPTSGTIYKGGGKETLRVNVRTEVVEE